MIKRLYLFSPAGTILILLLFSLIAINAVAQDKSGGKKSIEIRDSSGVVREKGYIDGSGKRNGMWSFYDKEGKLSMKIKYRRDIPLWTFYYENGRVTQSINRKGKVKKRECNCPN